MRYSAAQVSKLLANKRPELNAYQLACGYLQFKVSTERHVRVTLWYESAHYHVRASHEDNPARTGYIEWNGGIDNLREARAEYRRMVNQYIRGENSK